MERQNTQLGIVLSDNKELIDTFVQLATGCLFDYKFAWFEEAVPRKEIKKILHLVEEEDIRNDIIVFVLSQYKNYKGDDFSSYLRLSLGLFVRDKVQSYIRQFKREEVFLPEPISIDELIDLRWALTDHILPLTRYEHYILYLFAQKCYPITEISAMVYQDVSTIRSTIRDIIKELTNV